MNPADYDLWISEAKNDFETGKILLKAKRYNGSVFSFVQAAEKAIKALLYLIGAKPWGHSLTDLLQVYENLGHAVDQNLKNIATELEKHYISSRYPDATVGITPRKMYTKTFTKNIREQVKGIFDFVENERAGISP